MKIILYFGKMATHKIPFILSILILTSSVVTAGPLGVGICYAGCAGVTVACFAAAGATFGTVPAAVIAASPALAACNSAFAGCYSACALALIAPTP
ncbi:uncharacterized protein LOC126901216 [Daktulosphaira vitifoliae]|uniref:uncharacterized protein LOC126901216 n=1 Tax=Daktulosphaira vitifoliae TaxID=58002 RepID=UPI0021AA1581|nr:uncharacterized protein LOC126901216 [Daktulosphaira vitifoliae]